METTRFDQITSTFAQAHSRRGAPRVLGLTVAGESGLMLLGTAIGSSEVVATHRRFLPTSDRQLRARSSLPRIAPREGEER